MSAVLIVVPVFALIAAGYAAVALRFISPTAHKGISEFAFSIAIPALLFRIVVVAEFPAVNAFAVWAPIMGQRRPPGSSRCWRHPFFGNPGPTARCWRSARSTATS